MNIKTTIQAAVEGPNTITQDEELGVMYRQVFSVGVYLREAYNHCHQKMSKCEEGNSDLGGTGMELVFVHVYY